MYFGAFIQQRTKTITYEQRKVFFVTHSDFPAVLSMLSAIARKIYTLPYH